MIDDDLKKALIALLTGNIHLLGAIYADETPPKEQLELAFKAHLAILTNLDGGDFMDELKRKGLTGTLQ